MKIIETAIPEVVLIEPIPIEDTRGYLFESYHQKRFVTAGITDNFVQDNQVFSVRGVLRGLHYQIEHPQAKLCRVISGEVLDVVVDIRRGSPYFGKSVSAILSAENRRQVYVPKGFAHGYLVLSEAAEFLYKCSDFYYPEYDRGIIWNDAELAIDWGIMSPILSAKDQELPRLAQVALQELPKFPDDSLK